MTASPGPVPAEYGAPTGPVPLSDAVRDRLRRQPTRDTLPELALRRELHRRGLRYRVDTVLMPGVRRRADVVFARARVAVFVDGCFWHRCPDHGTAPRHNAGWWAAKLDRTVARDRDTDARLVRAGWTVVRVWEHERANEAADRVEQVVRPSR
ncbi:MAG: very short patch repair endonuclease [Kineosporiaceae bacterium]